MKIIILAGGWGSRLGHLSESVPKPMITNYPFILSNDDTSEIKRKAAIILFK